MNTVKFHQVHCAVYFLNEVILPSSFRINPHLEEEQDTAVFHILHTTFKVSSHRKRLKY